MASYDDEYNRLENQLKNLKPIGGMGIDFTAAAREQIESQMRQQVALRDEAVKPIADANAAWHQENQKPKATSSAAQVSPPSTTPQLPSFKPLQPNYKNFKMAPIDAIQFDENNIEIAMITDLLFEDIGATELANISRTDLIDGQQVIYAPIKNLPEIRRDFNPNNIVATSYALDYFSRFGIDLSIRGIYEPYFNDDGDLVIEIDTVSEEEEIQVQILIGGTIDEVDEA